MNTVEANSKNSEEEKYLAFYGEAYQMSRHYGNMRFSMFTVFSAILGALLSVTFGKNWSFPEGLITILFRVSCILLAVLFTFSEWRIGRLIVFYQELADDYAKNHLGQTNGLPSGHQWWKWLASIIMVAPFVFSALIWAAILIYYGGNTLCWSE